MEFLFMYLWLANLNFIVQEEGYLKQDWVLIRNCLQYNGAANRKLFLFFRYKYQKAMIPSKLQILWRPKTGSMSVIVFPI